MNKKVVNLYPSSSPVREDSFHEVAILIAFIMALFLLQEGARFLPSGHTT